MYKLVAIDLDGTLLNSYGEVSNENRDAIKCAKEKGIEVVIASGRMPIDVKNLSLEIGADKYMIAGNGTIVYDIEKDEIIYDAFMEKDKVLNIIKICEDNSIYYNIYTTSSIITKSLNYNVLYYNYENSKKPDSKKANINIVEDVYDYINNINTSPVLKMTICDNDKIIFGSIIRKLRQIQGIDVLDVSHMSRKVIKSGTEEVNIEYCYTEVSNKDVNKWTAIEFLMQKMDIKKEEVVGIGDNINDKEMIENAGLGVTMGKSALSAAKIRRCYCKR